MTTAIEPLHFFGALGAAEKEILTCPESDQPKFRYRANKLRLEIEKYSVVYEKVNQRVAQIEGPKPEQLADTRRYQQLETAVEGQQKYVEGRALIDQHIKNASKGRYDLLQQDGFPHAKNSLDFYQLRARDKQLINGESIPILPPESSKLKRMFFNFIKISAGLICGLSLNKIINPDNYEIITAALLFVGAGFGVFMLHLSKSLSFRAKIAPKPTNYLIMLGLVVGLFMIAEGYLNYEGVISATREMAMESSGDGLLLDEIGHVEEAPENYSLLVFTLILVLFAAFSAALEGRDQAVKAIHQQSLDKAVAELRSDQELMQKGAEIDKPEFLKGMRHQIQRKPIQKALVKWNDNVIEHLSKQEEMISSRVSEVSRELEEQSNQIQSEIQSLAEDIYMSQTGQRRKIIIPFEQTV